VQIVEGGDDDDDDEILVPERSFMVLPVVVLVAFVDDDDDDDDPMFWTREPSRSDQAWMTNTKKRNRINMTRASSAVVPTWTPEVLGLDRWSLLTLDELDGTFQLLVVFSFLLLSLLMSLLLLGTTTPVVVVVVVVRRLGKLELSLWLRRICREMDRVKDDVSDFMVLFLLSDFGRMGLFHELDYRYLDFTIWFDDSKCPCPREFFSLKR
jgi:hypothetical protein